MLSSIIVKQPNIESRELEQFLKRLEQESIYITPVMARLLLIRGIDTCPKVQEFLTPDLSSLSDPFLMKGMSIAIDLIQKHISENNLITIYGDYDVDGVTSTTILYKTLLECNANVSYYIPDRIEEGYGMNVPAIEKLIDTGSRLIISVDTGITAVEQVQVAKARGIDIVITDHHECQEILPKADAILNPKQSDCNYPFKSLAGVGVTYKLVQALAKTYNLSKEFVLDLLEIVAVGTVADLVPLIGENRTLVYHAFLRMENMKNIGLKALFDVAGVDVQKRSAGVIGFQIGPRLNAAGRLGDAKRGVELFLSKDIEVAAAIAEELNVENQKRREMEELIFAEAEAIIEESLIQEDPKILVVAHDGWHHGVIGIVASRITEKYYRPTILLAIEDDIASGSARSVDGFSIFEALMSTKYLFTKVGGHEMAAGMSLPKENIDELRKNLNDFASSHMSFDTLIRKTKIEHRLSMEEVSIDFIESLELMEPYGMGNEEPRFLLEGRIHSMELMGKEKNHFKLKLMTDINKRPIDAISFYGSDYYEDLMETMPINLIGTLQINEWKTYKNPQIFIKSIIYERTIEATLLDLKNVLTATQSQKDVGMDIEVLWSKLIAKHTELQITRESCVNVYKNLKKLLVNEKKYLDIAQLFKLNTWEENPSYQNNTAVFDTNLFIQRYIENSYILAIFIELELVTITMSQEGKIGIEVNSSKKVELSQSKMYNKMCCQND